MSLSWPARPRACTSASSPSACTYAVDAERVSPGGCAGTLDFPALRPRQAEAACVIAPAARARIGLPHPQRARTPMALIPGTRLDHYEILGLVGAGGMAQSIAPATRS